MSENINPTEKQMEFFYEDKFIQENSLIIIEGNNQYKDRELNLGLSQFMGVTEFQLFEKTVDVAKRFLALKRIVDNFGIDHTSRRKWRMEMGKKYGKPFVEFYQSDKNRVNKLSPLLNWIRVALKSVKRMNECEVKDRLLELEKKQPDLKPYAKMSPEQREDFTKELEKFVSDFLNIVTI